MYKGTSDKASFLNRVSSHATKESRTRRIDTIPSWAQQPEEYYNSVRDQWKIILDQMLDAQKKLTEVNEKLRHSMPRSEFDHCRQHKERLAARISMLQIQQADYRRLARAAGEKSWALMFYLIARRLLKPEDLALIESEVRLAIERDKFEIKAGEGELSDEQREVRRRKAQLKRRRVRWRKTHGGSVTVWADNQPISGKFKEEIK